ncbi:MAG: hypothetical protein K6D96_06750 [Acetatifactor sp.]|nr:hypothetical protein [Acetatifactor sp.]
MKNLEQKENPKPLMNEGRGSWYVPALQIISMKYPKAVFAMDSAFYYHGLTDVIPEKYCIATDRDAAKICQKNIIQIFENKNLLNLGVEQMEREGCVINIYSNSSFHLAKKTCPVMKGGMHCI